MNRLVGIGALSLAVFGGLTFVYSPTAIPAFSEFLGLKSEAAPPPQADPHDEDGHAHESAEKEKAEPEGKIKISDERVGAAKIGLSTAGPGILSRRLSVPGTVTPDRNRVGRVAAKVIGTVAELKKRLGDPVTAGEVVAILDSREVADAKSEFIGAMVNFNLQDTLYQREKTLWEKKISAEQRLLRAQATHQEAQVRRNLSRQKLSALGVSEKDIAELSPTGTATSGLERYEITAPLNGRVVEQLVDLGTPVGGEGQAKELYAIADLSSVWVELTVSTADLPQIKEGQRVTISSTGTAERSQGTISFTSPILNEETRSARVIASVENSDLLWRPGSFVVADIAVEETTALIQVPKSALQNIEGAQTLFIRTPEGFDARQVTVGGDDGQSVEITSGLSGGETIASVNTFLLKAELGKSEAGHSH